MNDPVRNKGSIFRKKMIAAFLVVFFLLISAALVLIARSSDTAYYTNRKERISISHPKEWKVLDRSNYNPIFDSLRRKLNSENDNLRLVCAFSCTRNFEELNPLIIIAVRPIADDFATLSPEGLGRFLTGALRENPNLSEGPEAIKIGDRNFVRYASTSNLWDIEWDYVYYHIIEDNKLYLISLWSRASHADSYEEVLRGMLKSLKFL